jgi:hypothetical protein
VSTGWPQSAGARHVRLPETSIQRQRIRPVSSTGHGFPFGASRKIRKPVWLTMAVIVPQPGPDLNPMVLTCGNSLCLILANARPWRVRRSGAHHDVSEGDLNTGGREISPDRGNHAMRVTRAGRTYPGIPRRVRYLARCLASARQVRASGPAPPAAGPSATRQPGCAGRLGCLPC